PPTPLPRRNAAVAPRRHRASRNHESYHQGTPAHRVQCRPASAAGAARSTPKGSPMNKLDKTRATKANKKLTIARTSIRNLDADDLGAVAGGTGYYKQVPIHTDACHAI